MGGYMNTSETAEWETPQWLFDHYNKTLGWNFTVDVCANAENAKVINYYTEQDNGLLADWSGERIWCNPPYGRGIRDWVKKGYETWESRGMTGVFLLPSRTDTKWFHDYCLRGGEIYFLKGRLKFGGSKGSAPFPNIIWVLS